MNRPAVRTRYSNKSLHATVLDTYKGTVKSCRSFPGARAFLGSRFETNRFLNLLASHVKRARAYCSNAHALTQTHTRARRSNAPARTQTHHLSTDKAHTHTQNAHSNLTSCIPQMIGDRRKKSKGVKMESDGSLLKGQSLNPISRKSLNKMQTVTSGTTHCGGVGVVHCT